MKKVKEDKKSVREKIADVFDIPHDLALNMTKIYITGDRMINIENYKGIIEYGDDMIRVNTNIGIITIIGRKLNIKNITDDEIAVLGSIKDINFAG